MSTSGTILIADDEPSIVEFMTDFLSDEGYQVQYATTSASALAAILAAPPDLAFMDLTFDGLSGLDVIRAVRTHGIDIPVVIMTAATTDEQSLEAHGATAYLPKPFDLDDLLACVGQYVRV